MSPLLRRKVSEKKEEDLILFYAKAQKIVDDLVKELRKAYPRNDSVEQYGSSDKNYLRIIIVPNGRRETYLYRDKLGLGYKIDLKIDYPLMYCKITNPYDIKSIEDFTSINNSSTKSVVKRFRNMILAFTDKN